jgi:hypothetical protein
MATFGPIASANPNVLFDPARAIGAAQDLQRNQLLMDNTAEDRRQAVFTRDRDVAARVADAVLRAPADQQDALYSTLISQEQSQGRLPHAPMQNPGAAHLATIRDMGISVEGRMKLEAAQREADALAAYRQGTLNVQQGRLALSAARPPGSGRASSDDDELTFVPIGGPAPAGGAPLRPPSAPLPAGPQVGQAAPAPEVSAPAARLGGVDVAGPGAPPAPPAEPGGPPPGTRLMLRKGIPITTGLGPGQAWGVDPSGMRIPVDIPGVRPTGKPAEAPPVIGGNGLDSALMNILVAGDPSSPQYAAAFARLGAEEVLANGTTRRPDMSPFRVPTYRPPGVMEPGAPGAGAAAPGAEPTLPQGGRTFGKAETTQAPKEVPAKVADGMLENVGAVRKIDDALLELTARKGEGVGLIAGNLPTAISSRTDPGGVKLRALIADIGSLKLHDRSGANVTASESPRLLPFIPLTSDDADTVRTKLQNFRREYLTALRDQQETYGPATGHKPMPPVQRLLEGAGGGASGGGGGGQRRKVATPEEARKLPSGTLIELPDGSPGVVP